MTSNFPIQKERRVSITLLFIGMIVISKAYQPSSRFCKPTTTRSYQRSFNLNSLVETNKKELTAKSLSDEVSDETGAKGNSIDTVRDIPSSPIFERVQRSLARLTEIVPRPVTLAVVAVASSLLLFELSKTLLFLAVPVIAVLGNCRMMLLVTILRRNSVNITDSHCQDSHIKFDYRAAIITPTLQLTSA
jgi:hypothetical protein